MKKMYVVGLILLAAFVMAPLTAQGQVFFMENPNVGKEAKDFTLGTLEAGALSLNAFREGKKAMIFFWATWCPHCREALDEIKQRRQEIEDKGIKIVLVDVGESRQVVKRYLEKNDIPMDVFLDEATAVSDSYGVIGIPTFYYIGEDGIVRNVRNTLAQDLENVFYGG